MNDKNHRTLVPSLRRKADGKAPSRKDAQLLAILMSAEDDLLCGASSGIATLLTDQVVASEASLRRARGQYDLVKVPSRRRGSRCKARRQVSEEHALIVKLAELYIATHGKSPRSMNAIVRSFCEWVDSESKNQSSIVARLLDASNPDLIDRKAGWWKQRIAERRKRIRNKKNES